MNTIVCIERNTETKGLHKYVVWSLELLLKTINLIDKRAVGFEDERQWTRRFREGHRKWIAVVHKLHTVLALHDEEGIAERTVATQNWKISDTAYNSLRMCRNQHVPSGGSVLNASGINDIISLENNATSHYFTEGMHNHAFIGKRQE